ncbi:MAG: hypothetical protein ABFD60_10615 [Bryobacteraceae bacterium]
MTIMTGKPQHEMPISKSQIRALRLLGLTIPSGYTAAGDTLESKNCKREGIPAGMTWRQAAKLSDADLLATIRVEPDYEDRSIDGTEGWQ